MAERQTEADARLLLDAVKKAGIDDRRFYAAVHFFVEMEVAAKENEERKRLRKVESLN